MENKQGRLYEVCRILGEKQINIRALTIAESEGYGVLRIVVDKPAEAVNALKERRIVVKETEIVAVEVIDKPGGLAAILQVLTESAVNVEYMYGFMEKFSDKALLVFRFDDSDKAIRVLQGKGIRIVGRNDFVNL